MFCVCVRHSIGTSVYAFAGDDQHFVLGMGTPNTFISTTAQK